MNRTDKVENAGDGDENPQLSYASTLYRDGMERLGARFELEMKESSVTDLVGFAALANCACAWVVAHYAPENSTTFMMFWQLQLLYAAGLHTLAFAAMVLRLYYMSWQRLKALNELFDEVMRASRDSS
jgi:hypothetical protein